MRYQNCEYSLRKLVLYFLTAYVHTSLVCRLFLCSVKLNRVIFGLCFFSMSASIVFSQEIPFEEMSRSDYLKLISAISLNFKNYITPNTYTGKHSTPILQNDRQKRYTTLIMRAGNSKPNYNGKYCITEFGCGSSCQFFFIINLETGKVIDGVTSEFGIKYSVDSNLIIINPSETILEYWKEEEYIPKRCATSYYLLQNEKLLKILDVNPLN